MYRLLYVSESSLVGNPDPLVQEIVASSLSRNATLGVTGALLFCESYFAQLLEGPEASVAQLMESISLDPRHTALRTLLAEPAQDREFSQWSLAYFGPASLLQPVLNPLLAPDPPREKSLKLIAAMRAFSG